MCTLGPAFEGKNYNQTNEFWQNYLGTSTSTLKKTTRLVIFQGGYDRAWGPGTPNLGVNGNLERARVIFTPGVYRKEERCYLVADRISRSWPY
jgi:hypothetical protein